MSNCYRLLLIVISFALCSYGKQASADEIISDDYPGRGSGMIMRLADTKVSQGVHAYYQVYGNFPASWQEVVDHGLFDGSLVGFQMETINPDDPSLDFPGDVYYENNKGTAFVHTMDISGTPTRVRLQIPVTFSRTFQAIRDLGGLNQQQLARFNDYESNESQLLQFAILGELSWSLMNFRDVNERYPVNLDEFIDSGLSPISRNTINPLTSLPFRFDGSPGDIIVEFSNEKHAIIKHVDSESVQMPDFMYN